jgi:hypothetical protein
MDLESDPGIVTPLCYPALHRRGDPQVWPFDAAQAPGLHPWVSIPGASTARRLPCLGITPFSFLEDGGTGV